MAKLSALLEREPFSLWAPVSSQETGKGKNILQLLDTGVLGPEFKPERELRIRYAETEAAITLMAERDDLQYVFAGTEPRRIHLLVEGQPEPVPVFVEVVIESRVADVAERLSADGRSWLAQRINMGVRVAKDVLADAMPTCPLKIPMEVVIGEATNALFAVALGRDRSTEGWPDGGAITAFIRAAVSSAIRHYLIGQFEAMTLQASSARDHLAAARSTIRAAHRKAQEELERPFSTPAQQAAAARAAVQTIGALCKRLE